MYLPVCATHSLANGMRKLKRCLLALLLERVDRCIHYPVVPLRCTTGYHSLQASGLMNKFAFMGLRLGLLDFCSVGAFEMSKL
jgi:hypothetical protein